MTNYTLQLPPEFTRDELEKILKKILEEYYDEFSECDQGELETKEEEQLELALRHYLETRKITTILSFLSLSLLKVKLLKLMLRHREIS